MKQSLKYVFFLSLIVLLSGCVKEEWQEAGGSCTPGETTVKVTLRMPSASAPRTYAISDADENMVETIDVLAFNTNGYAYRAEATAITDLSNSADGAKKQFKVTLNKKPGQQTFVFLANVRAQLEELGTIAIGADKNELLARLVIENPGSWAAKLEGEDTFTPFPFWGETSAIINDATTDISGLKLLRGIARMDIALGANVKNFVLNEIYIYNSKNKGCVVPAPGNLDGTDKVKAATVPAGDINNDTPLKYIVPDAMRTRFEQSMYLFESQAVASNKSSEATCVVVGGTYENDSKPTYYRIDFFKKDKDGKSTTEYCDILRNFRYQFNIKKVSGSGYDTPDEAFKAKPVNMLCEITDWDDNFTDIDTDGQYCLKVSNNPVELPGDLATNNELIVFTDYPGGWKATTSDTWITLQTNKGDADKNVNLIFDVDNNIGAANNRQGYIDITAGTINKRITITQSNQAELKLEVTLEDGTTLAESFFFRSQNPAPQNIRVSFAPDNVVCKVTVGNTMNGGVTLQQTLPTGVTNGQTLEIAPESIEASEIAKDAFIEKETIVNFMVTDTKTGKKVSQNIILTQTNYALKVTKVLADYPMDGKTKTFKVESNLPWKATIKDGNTVKNIISVAGDGDKVVRNFNFNIVDDIHTTPTIRDGQGIIEFSSNSNDPLRDFNDNINVTINGFSGYLITYNGSEYIADFEDYTSGSKEAFSYAEAVAYCTSKGSKWMLPNVDIFELINNTLTPKEQFGFIGDSYWTSEPGVGLNEHRAWQFSQDRYVPYQDIQPLFVRCVYPLD